MKSSILPQPFHDPPELMINSVPFRFHPIRLIVQTMCFNSAIQTSGMHPSRRTYVPLFSKPLGNIYSVLPVTFWSCLHQKKSTSFSDLQSSFDMNMKTRFKTTGEKKSYVYHPERISDDTSSIVHGFPPSCKRYTSIVWSRENEQFRPYMAILRTKTYLDDHLQRSSQI